MEIRSGKRGRPLKVDLEELIEQYEEAIPKSLGRLAQLRKSSKGIRDSAILGTQTSLPKWIEEGRDILEASKLGRIPTYKEIKDIRTSLRSMKQLQSKQERVFSRAISTQLKNEYERQLTEYASNKGKFYERSKEKILTEFRKLNPKQQQELLQSKYYQDPKTLSPSGTNIEAIKKWSKKELGLERISADKARAYLLERRLLDGIQDIYYRSIK